MTLLLLMLLTIALLLTGCGAKTTPSGGDNMQVAVGEQNPNTPSVQIPTTGDAVLDADLADLDIEDEDDFAELTFDDLDDLDKLLDEI
tara:strand:- start:50 stop:313 length:264 start_codon:yes stop_codon:yes gene_type:complete